MASIAMMIGAAIINAAAFSAGGVVTQKLTSSDTEVSDAETVWHERATEKFDADTEAYRRAREKLADWEEEQEKIRQQDLDDMAVTDGALNL